MRITDHDYWKPGACIGIGRSKNVDGKAWTNAVFSIGTNWHADWLLTVFTRRLGKSVGEVVYKNIYRLEEERLRKVEAILLRA